jgi:hypothetical protein
MIRLLRPDQATPTEFTLAMGEGTGILPDLPAVAGKPVHVGFDGGRMTSDAGILLLSAIEQRLKIAERLAACIEDPRDPDRVHYQFAEMIRYRALLIAAGYPDGNDCDPLSDRLRRSRRPHRQVAISSKHSVDGRPRAAAVANGAAYPWTNPSAQPQTPLRASATPRKTAP